MNNKRNRSVAGIVTLLAVSLFLLAPAMANEVTITGKVNDNFQIVANDGMVYEVADNEMGNQLLEQHVGKTVEVTGEIFKPPDGQDTIINVIAYTVLDK